MVVSSELLSELRSSLASTDDSESDEYLLNSISVLSVFVPGLTRVLFLRLIAFFEVFCWVKLSPIIWVKPTVLDLLFLFTGLFLYLISCHSWSGLEV